MINTNNLSSEHISSLADGRLAASERAQVVQSLLSSADGLQTWHRYHVVGDVLRSAELAPSGDDHAFWERLSQTLVLEPLYPTVHVNEHDAAAVVGSVIAIAPKTPSRMSANDSVWRWRLLAGVSTAALLIAVGLGLGPLIAPEGGTQLATTIAPPSDLQVVDSSQGAMLRDPHLDQLMAAHQQLGGHSALQVPAGFLRNATYEGAR